MNQTREQKLHAIREYGEEQYDRLLVFLSSGGLVLTLGFVNKVIDINESSCKSLLIITWILFVLSLMSILVSHRTSVKSIDIELRSGKADSDESEYWDNVTKFLNWFSTGSLILGIIVFIVFISINLF